MKSSLLERRHCREVGEGPCITHNTSPSYTPPVKLLNKQPSLYSAHPIILVTFPEPDCGGLISGD